MVRLSLDLLILLTWIVVKDPWVYVLRAWDNSMETTP